MCDHKKHLIERQRVRRGTRNCQVTHMNWVECAPKYPDSSHADDTLGVV